MSHGCVAAAVDCDGGAEIVTVGGDDDGSVSEMSIRGVSVRD